MSLSILFGYFNILIGSIMILIGFKIYKPFKGEHSEETFGKVKNLYRFGGIALLFWGLFKIL
jgi:hypothetical protein